MLFYVKKCDMAFGKSKVISKRNMHEIQFICFNVTGDKSMLNILCSLDWNDKSVEDKSSVEF